MDLIVEDQRMIAFTPIVPDPRVGIDDQGVHVELGQPGGGRQASLSASNNQYLWIVIFIGDGRVPSVLPIRPFKIA